MSSAWAGWSYESLENSGAVLGGEAAFFTHENTLDAATVFPTSKRRRKTALSAFKSRSKMRQVNAEVIIPSPAETRDFYGLRSWRAEIPIQPIAKGRPRFTRLGKTYTPKRTSKYEQDLRSWFLANKPPRPLLSGPLKMFVTFVIRKPKKERRRLFWHTSRPDLSNLVKCVEDAANGILWGDDSQVASMRLEKTYGDTPVIRLRIEEAHEDEVLVIA